MTVDKATSASAQLTMGSAAASVSAEFEEIKVTGISLDKTELEMTVGKTEKLTASIVPYNAKNKSVAWSVVPGGSDVVEVKDGTVTAKKPGSATVRVMTADGSYTADCRVVVAPQYTVTFNTDGSTADPGQQVADKINDLPDDQKKKVSEDTLKKLTDAETALAEAQVKSVKTVTVNAGKINAKTVNKAVAKAGGSSKYVKNFIIGKKIKKISKGSFKNYKNAKTLVVKTRKLKKSTVKNSLKGSKITRVKVKVGNKKTNKKYVKKYKTIFTKKNAGRKVKVSL